MNLSVLNRKLSEVSPTVKAEYADGALHLTGSVDRYGDLVRCGVMATRVRSRGVVNDIVCTTEVEKPMRLPLDSDKSLDGRSFDVIVIGAGVVGCAVARELSLRNLSVAVLEKEYDVAVRTSSRNDGMIHPGIDLHKNQEKTRYNCLGNRLYSSLSEELGFHFTRNGSYVVFDRWWNLLTVPVFKLRARQNHVDGIKFIPKRKLSVLQSAVAPWQKGAIYLPSSGIVRPYEVTVAFAENAVANGASVFFNTAVLGMEMDGNRVKYLDTNRGRLSCSVVVNAAGVYSDRIAAMANDRFFSIHPRKGTEFILDSDSGHLTASVLAKVPFSDVKQHTKGGGVVRTVDGNLLVGPDATETIQREDDSTEALNINRMFSKHSQTVPELDKRQIIAYFSGTRACTYEEDFIVRVSERVPNLVHAAGIQSPGLTAAPAIARKLASDIETIFSELYRREVHIRPDAVLRREKTPVVSEMSPEERDALIRKNPDYGQIVCRCEQISKGELLYALRSDLPVYNMDALKRRCRAGMGRCQGGFCSPLVAQLIAGEAGISLDEVRKGLGNFLSGRVKEPS